jgi:hypothetical protein
VSAEGDEVSATDFDRYSLSYNDSRDPGVITVHTGAPKVRLTPTQATLMAHRLLRGRGRQRVRSVSDQDQEQERRTMTNDVQWVQRRPGLSWHILRTFTRAIDGARTACGIPASAASARDDRPANERTCERCYRLVGPE